MKKQTFIVSENIPTVEEYLYLRKMGGLSAKSIEGAKVGLSNSYFAITVREDDQLIAMGRIVGDGGTVFQLVDIVVEPSYQGRGLGKLVMEHLMTYVKETIDPQAYVNLIADGKAKDLYAQYGFIETLPNSCGMFYKR
ncbi:MAG: GNAT family N-acetyltransferase [Vagococcus sp.]|uniref:GNAT family N-acetyltransferase n=1 Tax=Vagococcus TaxID=2737 RepID=UPI002FCC7409